MSEAAQEYAKRAAEWCKFKGKKDGEFPVIDRDSDPEEWAAWKLYFASKGMQQSVAMMEQRQKWTVPEKNPQDFDSSFHPSVARPQPKPRRSAPEIRRSDAGGYMLSHREMRECPPGTIFCAADATITYPGGEVETWGQFRRRRRGATETEAA